MIGVHVASCGITDCQKKLSQLYQPILNIINAHTTYSSMNEIQHTYASEVSKTPILLSDNIISIRFKYLYT